MATTELTPTQTTGLRPFAADQFDLAASLLGFQGLLFLVTAVEASFMAALSGNAAGAGPVLLSGGLVAFSLIARIRLCKGGARRTVRIFQWSLLVWAAFDLAIALWLSSAALPLVAMFSRVTLPISVLVLTRRNPR